MSMRRVVACKPHLMLGHPQCRRTMPNANSHPCQYGGFLPSGNCSWTSQQTLSLSMQGWVGSTGAAQKKAALDNVQWHPRQRNTWPLLSRSEQVTHLQAENRPQLKHERPHLYRDWNWLINQNRLTSNICCKYDCYTLGHWFRKVTRKLDSSLDDYSKQQPSSTGSVSIWVTKRWTHHSGSKTAKSNQWNQSCRSSSLALLPSLPFSFTPDYFPLSEKKPVPIPAQFQYIPSKRTGQSPLKPGDQS